MLKVDFGEQPMGRTQIFEWFSKFNSSVTSAEDDKLPERPSMSETSENVDQMLVSVLKNVRTTICEVANKLEVSFESVHSILKENLNMCWITAKFKIYLLRKEQKENHVNMCQDLPLPP
jgi:hypothetical protein